MGVQVSLFALIMKKLLAALGAFTLLPAIVFANENKIKKGFYTYDAMGCMLLRECTENVEQVYSLFDISSKYENPEKFISIASEFNAMLVYLNQAGANVFIADERYFPVGHRGVYHTVSNNFFLNKRFMSRPGTLMGVMRHEGWHAAQDCMGGTIENNIIAIIKPEEEVPMLWREMAERTYPSNVVLWEAEATWAGKTKNMTLNALKACATGEMWNVYPPTPLTKQYLIDEGYIKED